MRRLNHLGNARSFMVPEYHASAGQACPDSRENVAGRLDRSDADAAGMIREAPTGWRAAR